MKDKFVEIFNKSDIKISYNKKPSHQYKRYDIVGVILSYGKDKESITGGNFMMKNPSAKNISSFYSHFNKSEVKDYRPILEELMNDDNYLQFRTGEYLSVIIRKDILNLEARFYPSVANNNKISLGIKFVSSPYVIEVSPEYMDCLKYFKNFKLNDSFLTEKIRYIEDNLARVKTQEAFYKCELKKVQERVKEWEGRQNQFKELVHVMKENIDADEYATQKLLYEMTKGSFK